MNSPAIRHSLKHWQIQPAVSWLSEVIKEWQRHLIFHRLESDDKPIQKTPIQILLIYYEKFFLYLLCIDNIFLLH